MWLVLCGGLIFVVVFFLNNKLLESFLFVWQSNKATFSKESQEVIETALAAACIG